jgi:hypothetical protein
MQDRGLSDLSWLDVDPEDYRAKEALPKQNLDIIPELQRALTYDDSGVPALIPLRPHTLVNTNPLDAPSAVSKTSSAEVANKVARHLMSGSAPRQVGEKLMLEFSPGQIRHASASISSVLSERGLIGNVYVDSKHFPRCSQNSDDKKFVATRAAGAKFVLSKSECSGCLHNRGGMCANLHKQIVHSVPYDKKTFAHYAVQLSSEGRLDSAGLDAALTGSDFDRRRVLKSSFSTPALQAKADSSGLYLRHQAKVAKPAVTDEQADAYLARPRSDQPVLGRGFTAAVKHLMLGGSPDPLHGSLDDSVRRVASEHGLLGHTYLDMDALGGCGVTLSFLSRMDYMPDFIVRRSSCCEECKGASDGACAQIQKICHISDRSDIGKENFVAALLRAADRGAIDIEQARHAASKAPAKSNWRRLTAQANFLQPVEGKATYSGARVSAHYGAIVPAKEMTPSKPMDAEEVRRSISHMMNTGLRGKALAAAILQRYARSDLARVPRVGASLAGNDGVQGTYFIDPTAYSDYGRGCVIGAKKFRKIGAENVFAGESCIGCAMQTAPGWCAKYAKSLIRSVPASVAAAAAEATRRPVACSDAPVDNPVDSYQLSASITVEPDKSRVLPSVQFADSDALDAV